MVETQNMLADIGFPAWTDDLCLSCSGSGGEADEPAAECGLQWGRGPAHLLWHLRGRGPPAPMQDANYPQRPQGEEGVFPSILLPPSSVSTIGQSSSTDATHDYFHYLCIFFIL